MRATLLLTLVAACVAIGTDVAVSGYVLPRRECGSFAEVMRSLDAMQSPKHPLFGSTTIEQVSFSPSFSPAAKA